MKIGVFDSGIGGLTVLKELLKELPQYDYVYLGDNARTPYGTRSYEKVYQFTLAGVKELFNLQCDLVILACNTASAKALRTIQQNDLIHFPGKKVLGVIRPCTESASTFTKSGHLGILATEGTVNSSSYLIEIEKFFPHLKVTQEACPIWVPLVEQQLYDTEGGQFFIRRHWNALKDKDPNIDAIVLACTHYPILMEPLKEIVGPEINIISQGEIVAKKLKDYLERHQEIGQNLSLDGTVEFYTSEQPEIFNTKAGIFLDVSIDAKHLEF